MALPPVPATAPLHTPAGTVAVRPPQPGLDSRELMRGAREVLIHHGGQVYRLLHTRNDKLILVK